MVKTVFLTIDPPKTNVNELSIFAQGSFSKTPPISAIFVKVGRRGVFAPFGAVLPDRKPVLRLACGMGVGPSITAGPGHSGTKALRRGIRVLVAVAGLCQLKNHWLRSFLVTETVTRPGPPRPRAVMVTQSESE